MVDSYTLVEAGPAYTPARFGLFSVAEPVNSPARWRMGIERDSMDCGPAGSIVALPCVTGIGTELEPNETAGSEAATPFQVYSWLPCSPVGYGDDLSGLKRRTQALLTNGEARAVDRVFWTGATSTGTGTVYPHLASDAELSTTPQGAREVLLQRAATEVTTAAVDAVEALGAVEHELASCYGGEPVIHVPRLLLAHLDHYGVVRQSGQQLRTLSGSLVAGYSGSPTQPDGTAPTAGTAWIYGTGAVQVYRGPIVDHGMQAGDFVGRSDNSTVYVAGRAYVITYDCCLVAAEVSTGGAVTGAAGSSGGQA